MFYFCSWHPKSARPVDLTSDPHDHTIMVMSTRTVAAGEFKATCLALLDQVARTGRELVVTKRGKPVAKLVPVTAKTRRPLSKSVLFIADDIVLPSGEIWNADR